MQRRNKPVGPAVERFDQVPIPRNEAQRAAEEMIQKVDWMFLAGPAGTGKTHQAVKMAVRATQDQKYLGFRPKKIILSRPTVEAGPHRLGHLPGDINEKLAPWLQPIHDVLSKITTVKADVFMKSVFDVVTFQHMRGRTFDDAIVIIDEAQNCTWDLLELAYCRLGQRAKMLFTGDHTQSDLPPHQQAFPWFMDALHGLESTACIYFDDSMIVRNSKLGEGLKRIRAGKTRWQQEKPPEPLTGRRTGH